MTLDSIVTFLPAHEAQITVVVSAVSSLLSLALVKWPRVSKVFGTIAMVDLGRILRIVVRMLVVLREARKDEK